MKILKDISKKAEDTGLLRRKKPLLAKTCVWQVSFTMASSTRDYYFVAKNSGVKSGFAVAQRRGT